jgi:uncharacterized membrane protein
MSKSSIQKIIACAGSVFTRSPFLHGIATLGNFAGNYYDRPIRTTGFPHDLDALRRDWKTIGDDLHLILTPGYKNRNRFMNGPSEINADAERERLLSKVFTAEELIKILHLKKELEAPQQALEHTITITTEFSGSIPAPHTLAAYEQVLPGCADRLITAFEEQYKNRIEIERHESKSRWSQSAQGQVMSCVLVLCCLGIAAWMGVLGHAVLAGILGTTTVVSLATIYFLGKKAQSTDGNVQNQGQ